MINLNKVGYLTLALGTGLASLAGCAVDTSNDAESAVQQNELTAPGAKTPSPADEEVRRVIDAAVSPLDGANPALTKAITLSEAPLAVRAALVAASKEIKARTFEGTDYEAWVEGVYVVYASPAKDRVVAYVVHGLGSGEPDYNDGLVIGFDLSGRRIYDNEDGG